MLQSVYIRNGYAIFSKTITIKIYTELYESPKMLLIDPITGGNL